MRTQRGKCDVKGRYVEYRAAYKIKSAGSLSLGKAVRQARVICLGSLEFWSLETTPTRPTPPARHVVARGRPPGASLQMENGETMPRFPIVGGRYLLRRVHLRARRSDHLVVRQVGFWAGRDPGRRSGRQGWWGPDGVASAPAAYTEECLSTPLRMLKNSTGPRVLGPLLRQSPRPSSRADSVPPRNLGMAGGTSFRRKSDAYSNCTRSTRKNKAADYIKSQECASM